MWNHCGVVRNATSMNEGLEKLEELKSRSINLDIRVDSYSSNELIAGFNLKASICAAEATLLSALERRESRGSHQRSDYPEINDEQSCNYMTTSDSNGQLKVSKKPLSGLKKELVEILSSTEKITNFSGKLLE